ncbi:MAG: fibrobacter succinogenes major paralogous domain-containing protein [Bacteroidota bacterium]|nr:fibrobacter succinogenes major paralogous domain-containing protein [Bacteroidota bacterium]
MRKVLFQVLALILLLACEKEDPGIKSGSFIDNRDSREYKWVKIGDQIWMAENFAYKSVLLEGSNFKIWENGHYLDSLEQVEYERNRGCLYNYKTAISLCPPGWHLPTDEEWFDLESYLGMKKGEIQKKGERGVAENVGGKLKDTGTSFWDPPNMGATNESGFTARPAGVTTPFDSSITSNNEVVMYWSISVDPDSAFVRFLDDSRYGIFRIRYPKSYPIAVRYLKDDPKF